MNTLHFKYAIEVERTGSISKAAENLFMAQPNLSKAIKELEETLKISIFERTSRGVIPTPQGKEFLERAKNVLAQVDEIKSLYASNKKGNCQSAKISIPRGTYISKAFSKLAAELDMEKEINIHVRETNSMETIMNVADNYYDFGIIRYQTINEKYFLDYLEKKDLKYAELWNFECLAVMNVNNKHVNDEKLTFEALAKDCVEIIHGDNIVPYIATCAEETLNHNEKSVRKIYLYERGSQFEILGNVPNSYMWTSPLPKSTLESVNVIQRKCYSPINSFKDVVVWKKGYKLSNIDKKFIEKLKAEIEILKNEKYE